MAIFALYHYDICALENKTPRVLSPDGEKNIYNSLEDLFESFIPKRGGSVDVWETKTKGSGENKTQEYEPHGSVVLQNKNHISAFKLQRNGKKKYETIDWETKTEGHYPTCCIIIDNRPGHQIMAIEVKSAFKIDKASEIIIKDFNRKLRPYNVCFECLPLEKHFEFWESVDEIRERFHDEVRRVEFDFSGAKKIGDENGKMANYLVTLANLISSHHGGVFYELKDDRDLHKAKDDLTHMAKLCYENAGYNLMVKFKTFGIFRFGQDVKAQYGLDDGKIEEFGKKYSQLDMYQPGDKGYNDIAKWFDYIKDIFADYIHEAKDKISSPKFIVIPDNKKIMPFLYQMFNGKLGKNLALLVECAIDAGIILKPTFGELQRWFDVKGSDTAFNKYFLKNFFSEREKMPIINGMKERIK